MPSADKTVYERVVRITHTYLGPAAERFIYRQVLNHIHKEPSKLTKDDLELLIDWIRAAVSLLTDDTEIVEEYVLQLRRIIAPPVKTGVADDRKKH